MSECHNSVHLEEKTKMPKTPAVWKHFKLSEDTTQAVCQICNLKTGLPQQHIVGVKKNELLLSAMLISNFAHDKNMRLICLENTCEYGSHKK